MNSTNLDQLLQHFDNKIEMIYKLLPLAKLYNNSNDKQNEWNRNSVTRLINNNNSDDYTSQLINSRPDLTALSEMTIEMKDMVQQMKAMIRQQKQQIIAQNLKCENDLKSIERHCDHINKNIPPFLQKNNQQKSKTDKTSNETANQLVNTRMVPNKSEATKPIAKTSQKALNKSNKTNVSVVSKPSEDTRVVTKSVKKKTSAAASNYNNPPTISFITTEEFSSIPNYMLGRLTYEVINRAIGDFNRTINAKYKLIAEYSTKYSDDQMRRYTNFKEQENTETDGQFFCTINDLKELSDLKVDNTVRKILTCLRHCKRVKEIRGNPPKLIRYAVIQNLINTENHSF